MALRSTQSLREMNTRNIYSGVKAAGAKGWQSYLLHVPTVLKSGSLNILEPSEPAQACKEIALPVPSIALDTSSHVSSAWILLTCLFSKRN